MTKLSFLFLLGSIFAIGHCIKLGEECGREPSRLYMYKKGKVGVRCDTCDAHEHWHVLEKRCKTCTGSMTNLVPNIRTTCKDEISHKNPILSSAFPKVTENETASLQYANVTMAPNNKKAFGAENTSLGVYGSSEVTENITIMPYWNNNTNKKDNASMILSTTTSTTETKEINTLVDSERGDDRKIIIILIVVILVLVAIIVFLCVHGRTTSQSVFVSSEDDTDVENTGNNESHNSLLRRENEKNLHADVTQSLAAQYIFVEENE